MVLPYKFGGIMQKQCTKCKEVKNISMFYRNKYKIDNRQSHCKICHNETTKKWRKDNPEKYSKYNCSPKRNKKTKIKSKMRSRRYRHNMSDRYIRDLMTMENNLKSEDISDELVQAYKVNLKLKRILNLTCKLKPLKKKNK
tara:strand:+ start:1243 stop:1665 length:423 start_codon:yes stop_codon:yes gene_type:complete